MNIADQGILHARVIRAKARIEGADASRLGLARDVLGVDSGAYRGELLAMVREAWGMPGIHVCMENDHWWVAEDSYVMLGDAKTTYGGDTETEALVAALEAAPQPGTVTP